METLFGNVTEISCSIGRPHARPLSKGMNREGILVSRKPEVADTRFTYR